LGGPSSYNWKNFYCVIGKLAVIADDLFAFERLFKGENVAFSLVLKIGIELRKSFLFSLVLKIGQIESRNAS